MASRSLDNHLRQQQLASGTRKCYMAIADRIGRKDPIKFLRKAISSETPIGTVLTLRAGVRHFLIGHKKISPEEADKLLPKAKGRPSKLRSSLSQEALDLYRYEVEEVVEPARTILLLLPETGMRIAEVCSLRRKDIQEWQGIRGFLFRGKRGKQRFIPFSVGAAALIDEYLSEKGKDSMEEDWLFIGYKGTPIQPHAIRKHTRKLATLHPQLKGLSPHVLRHTFATNALKKNMQMETLKVLLGHSSILTTSRYLHPDAEMLRNAIQALEG
jgi:site-specific recombinase XerD